MRCWLDPREIIGAGVSVSKLKEVLDTISGTLRKVGHESDPKVWSKRRSTGLKACGPVL